MKVKSESEVAQSCLTLSGPIDESPPGSSVHGISQARVLEWGAIAFSIYLNGLPAESPYTTDGFPTTREAPYHTDLLNKYIMFTAALFGEGNGIPL